MSTAFLAILIHTPSQLAWFSSSHRSHASGEGKSILARPSSAPISGRLARPAGAGQGGAVRRAPRCGPVPSARRGAGLVLARPRHDRARAGDHIPVVENEDRHGALAAQLLYLGAIARPCRQGPQLQPAALALPPL